MVSTVGISRDFADTPASDWIRFFPTPAYLCDHYMSPIHQLSVTFSRRSGVPYPPAASWASPSLPSPCHLFSLIISLSSQDSGKQGPCLSCFLLGYQNLA